MEKELDDLDDNKKSKTENNKVSSKRKHNLIIALIIVLVIAIIAIVVVRVNVTTVAGSEDEMLSTLKIGSDGTYELTVVNYASSDDSNGEQNFIIQKTDEYGNPLQGVEFEIAGNFRTSYTVEFYDADNSNTIMSDYTQVFYGSYWDDKYITTDGEGKISLTLQYGDYGIVESKSLYGYEDDENVYWIRVDKSGINIIDESKVDWDDANFDEADTINVSTASIKDTLGCISGYTLDHIELKGKNLGTSEDNLPTTVNDGDVIKIYMTTNLYYIVKFFVTDSYYPLYGECYDIDYSYIDYVDNAIYNINGVPYVEFDFETLFNIDYDISSELPKEIFPSNSSYDFLMVDETLYNDYKNGLFLANCDSLDTLNEYIEYMTKHSYYFNFTGDYYGDDMKGITIIGVSDGNYVGYFQEPIVPNGSTIYFNMWRENR